AGAVRPARGRGRGGTTGATNQRCSSPRHGLTLATRQASAGWTVRPGGPLWKHQREMQEERRQQQDRHRVAPVEDPVELVQLSAEGERERAEEDDREPEEMTRCLI